MRDTSAAGRASSLEHDPADALRKPSRGQSQWLKRLAGSARPPLLLAGAAPLAGGVLLVIQAWLLASVLDAAIARQAPRSDLLGGILGIAALMLVRACIAWAGERAGAIAAERIKRQVRLALFERLVDKGPHWSRGQASGVLASAVVDQVEALDGFFAKYLPAMAAAAMLPVAFSVLLFPVDVIAGLVLLITAPLIPLFMALVGWGAQGASRRHLRAFARLSGFFADRLRGLSTLKLYGRAEAEAESVAAASDALRQRTLSVLRIAFLSSAVLEFFAALGVAGVAVYIGLTYLGFLDLRWSVLTLQAGMFCLLMAPEVYAPLRQFAAHYHDRAAALAAVTQIDAVFDGLPDVAPAGAAPVAPAAAPRARPGFNERARPALDGARPSRAGARRRGACAGARRTRRADGAERHRQVLADRGDRAPAALRGRDIDRRPAAGGLGRGRARRIALIGQKPQLMAGTIAQNIRLGCPQASDEALREAARRARVLEFTERQPLGLDTVLGGRGQGLSGGQAQRVALARLFLRDPGLILLDEPTAHLDEDTQARVLDEILTFAAGRTLLIATHSPQVAARFGRTLRLADGKLEQA